MKPIRIGSELLWNLSGVVFVVGLIAVWAAATHYGWVSTVFVPPPFQAVRDLVSGLMDGDLLVQTEATLSHMILGWIVASLLGIALGSVIGISPAARAYLQPMLEVIRPLPASAVMPIAIGFFGLSVKMVLAVIAFGAGWPVLLATIQGFESIDPRLAEVARVLHLSRSAFVLKIGLPNAFPDILGGMRLSLTVSLILSVVGELLTSQDGLGTTILLAARSFHADDLFAGIILLGLIGLFSNAALATAERILIRWK